MIDKLEMFIALAAERHFGRAALACGAPQALSRRLSRRAGLAAAARVVALRGAAGLRPRESHAAELREGPARGGRRAAEVRAGCWG